MSNPDERDRMPVAEVPPDPSLFLAVVILVATTAAFWALISWLGVATAPGLRYGRPACDPAGSTRPASVGEDPKDFKLTRAGRSANWPATPCPR